MRMNGKIANVGWAGRMLRLGTSLLVLGFVFGVASQNTWSTDTVPAERVKAAYLRNFAKMVIWPETSFKDEDSPLIIGVLGEDPLGNELDEALRNRTAHGRRLIVRRLPVIEDNLPSAEQLSDCHLLFISASERDRLQPIFERLRGSNVMTVSDMEGFADVEGVADFILRGATLQFRLNRQAAEAAGLRPKARLLKAAIPVKPKD
jgi:hypothetical protein